MTTSLPVSALVVLGSIIAVLGLFAAGSIVVAAVGLVAVAVAACSTSSTAGPPDPSTDHGDHHHARRFHRPRIVLILVAIPFGLMFAPLALGVLFVWLGWRHLSASWQAPVDGAAA